MSEPATLLSLHAIIARTGAATFTNSCSWAQAVYLIPLVRVRQGPLLLRLLEILLYRHRMTDEWKWSSGGMTVGRGKPKY
jgi:hypothetical protein